MSHVASDFVKKDTNITFGPLRSMACTEIPVLDDTTQEFPETFAVGFGRVPPGSDIVPGPFSQSSVTIIDDDECKISYKSTVIFTIITLSTIPSSSH